jgi:hypothetical protein
MDNCLIHIGLPKTGSTFLKTWFDAHPQLLHVSGGIAGFTGTRDLIRFAVYPPDRHPMYFVTSSELFSSAWIGPETYLSRHAMFQFEEQGLRQNQARVCTLLHDLFPNARILLVTRGFRNSLRSGYSEYIKNGGSLDFHNFLLEFELQIRIWLDLNTLVNLYETIFGSARVLVLPHELLQKNPQKFFAVLEESLGLDHFEFQLSPRNRSLLRDEFLLYPRISRILQSISLQWKGGVKLYGFYVRHFLRAGRLKYLLPVIQVLRSSAPEMECPADYLERFRDKATILRNHPLYQEYADDYLWSGPKSTVGGTIIQE